MPAATHQQIQIELHRKLAPEYALRYGFPFSRHFQEVWHSEMLREAPPSARLALDIGCGTGFFLHDVRRKCDRAVGLDISFDMLQLARREVPGAFVSQGDAENLPFRDASFEVVFCKGALHHTRDHGGFLRNCFRILRPGGVLVLSEPCNDNPLIFAARWALYRLSSKFHPGDRGFRTRELARMVRDAGFEIAALRKFGALAYALAGFPDHVPLMRFVPGSLALTRALIAADRGIVSTPVLRSFGFHVICSARRPA
jgi:ubiquinone/menaquinone biosynthesis C-methylase UbiE